MKQLKRLGLGVVMACAGAGYAQDCEPMIVGGYNPGASTSGVAISGELAFVSNSESGLHVVNVSNPDDPMMIGMVSTPASAWRVTVDATHAYVLAGIGVWVIDVSDPADPTIVGSVPVASNVVELSKDGDIVCVASFNAGMHIIDASDPTDPTVVGNLGTVSFATGVQVIGDIAYLAADDLVLVDISTPENPSVLGVVFEIGAVDVAVSDSLAYVAANDDGLLVIDVSDPTDPQVIGSVDTPGNAVDVAIDGTLAHVADSASGLQVVNVSDPFKPVIIGSAVTPAAASTVAASDNVALIAAGFEGMLAADVTDCAACPADINGDGELSVLDFVTFQLLWQGQDVAADCDANGQFNVLDFVCFQLLFVEGCE